MTRNNPARHLPLLTLLLLVLLAIGVSSTSVPAQQRLLTDAQIAEIQERIEATRARLDLSPDQQAMLEPILLSGFEQRLEVLRSFGFSADVIPDLSFRQKLALRKEMNKLRKVTENDVAAVLDDTQLAEFKKIQEELRNQFKQRLRNRNS